MTPPPSLALVVLGARVLTDGTLGKALARRVNRAAQAWHEGRAPVVVCSGGREWSGHQEADRMRDRLVELGVDPESILLERRSLSTAENARQSTALLRERGLSAALVVTCPWHLRRALADFRLCGLEATGLAAEPGSLSLPRRIWLNAMERSCLWIDYARLTSGWA